jgi:hypothetical protein
MNKHNKINFYSVVFLFKNSKLYNNELFVVVVVVVGVVVDSEILFTCNFFSLFYYLFNIYLI